VAKIRNKRIYSDDTEYLKMLQKEYKDYGDWDTELNGDCLTIFALHRKYQRRKDGEGKKQERNKRNEKFERRD
jgi:hypothetical protein